jgi:hypothetical protein
VSNAAMRAHDFRGLWRLTLLTSCLSPIPLVLVKLLPKSVESQQKLQVRAGCDRRPTIVGAGTRRAVLFR